MHALLLILKDVPQVKPITLRPLMLRYIHHNQPLTWTFIANFQHNVALYDARHLHFKLLPIHAQQLVSTSDISEKEMEVLQNLITRINFSTKYMNIDSADSSLWETMEYLKEGKDTYMYLMLVTN